MEGRQRMSLLEHNKHKQPNSKVIAPSVPKLKENQYGQLRQLIIVDIENLVGNPDPSEEEVRIIHDKLQFSLAKRPEIISQFTIAYSHFGVPKFRFTWKIGNHIWRSSEDGADLALLKEISDPLHIRKLYSRVIIGSGDGIFAPAAQRLIEAGLRVDLIASEEHLSEDLRNSTHVLYPLCDLDVLPLAA